MIVIVPNAKAKDSHRKNSARPAIISIIFENFSMS